MPKSSFNKQMSVAHLEVNKYVQKCPESIILSKNLLIINNIFILDVRNVRGAEVVDGADRPIVKQLLLNNMQETFALFEESQEWKDHLLQNPTHHLKLSKF